MKRFGDAYAKIAEEAKADKEAYAKRTEESARTDNEAYAKGAEQAQQRVTGSTQSTSNKANKGFSAGATAFFDARYAVVNDSDTKKTQIYVINNDGTVTTMPYPTKWDFFDEWATSTTTIQTFDPQGNVVKSRIVEAENINKNVCWFSDLCTTLFVVRIEKRSNTLSDG